MTNLDSVLKSRDITLQTKFCLIKALVFPVDMYGCKSWTIKKAERRRIDAFELWFFERRSLLEKTPENSLDCKEIQPVHPKGNQPWIFIGRTDAEAPILSPPDAKSQFIGKVSDAGKDWRPKGEEGDRGWDGWMAPLTQWTWVWTNSWRQRRTGKAGVLQSRGSQRVGHDWATDGQGEEN